MSGRKALGDLSDDVRDPVCGRRIWCRTEYGIKTQAEETVSVCTTFLKRKSGRIRECQADPDVESQTGAGKRGVCKTTYEFC